MIPFQWRLLLPCVALLFGTSRAVFADEAYQVDYHHALLGLPSQHSTFFQQPYANSKASLIYTLSDQLLVGAVNPKDGALVWRQQLHSAPNETEGFLRAGHDEDIVISAFGKEVLAWAAADGKLAWSSQFPDGPVKDLEILELQDATASPHVKDAIALFAGQKPTLRRLDGRTGAVKWEYHDESGDAPYQVSASATNVFYISLHSTMLNGLKLKVTLLDPLTGRKVDQYSLGSESELSTTETIIFVGANSACPLLAWTDKAHKTLKINIIGNKHVASFPIGSTSSDIQNVTLHAPHRTTAVPHFLIHYQNSKEHWAEVYHINLKAFSITKAYDIPKLAGAGAFATSTTDANVYFTRLTADETFVFSSASHGILGRWPIARHSVSGWPENARPIHAVSEVVAKADSAHAVRSAVLLSTGDWVLVRNGDVDWSRPEELASATAAVFAEIPAAKTLARELELESHKSVVGAFIHRTTRHLKDLEYAPAWLLSVPNRLLQALSGTTSTTQTHAPGKDRYGFRKVIVVATENGRLVGLDSTGGEIIWNTVVPGLSTGYKGKRPTLRVYSQGVVGVSDDSTANVQYVDVLKGNILSPGDPVISTLTQEQDPHDVSAQRVTVTFKLADGELLGFLASSKNDSPLWRFSPSHQERILSIVQRPLDDPVASIGRVLGDRRVLYKYLNPNVLVVTTVSDTKNTMSVHLVDAVSGATLYSVTHASVDTSRPMTSTISENWFAYTFSAASSTHQSRGTQLVVADLYESTLPNDRGPLGSSANYSSLDVTSTSGEIAKPHLISQSYHIPEEISYMTVTQTRQGITTRQLLVALPESKAIAGISRTIIDPRRPVGRDPTAAEASEGLIRYTPVLDIDARSYLTHKREVVGIKEIKTCPSSLESTGLVFAYGLDVFGTRVSPSSTFDVLGKEFNKLQMLATVAALAVGVTFVAPLVRRKQINARWQIL